MAFYIYERGSSGWELAESYDKDDPDMTEYDSPKYGNTVYFYGDPGEEYRIVVTIFAEDQYGDSDSRSRTFTVTAR